MSRLVEKLQIKPGMVGGVFRCPPEIELDLPALRSLRRTGLDYVVVFVVDRAEVGRYAGPAAGTLREDGLLWFCYPKKSGRLETDLTRDQGWEPVAALGLRGCRQVAVDDTWSALRFRDPRFSRPR